MTINDFLSQWHDSRATVPVYTSGSTGKPKLMMAEKVRMEASARMTCKALGLKAGDKALVCLPMDYIAGKMMVVRSLVCDLQMISIEPKGHPMADIADDEEIDFAAMVPMRRAKALPRGNSIREPTREMQRESSRAVSPLQKSAGGQSVPKRRRRWGNRSEIRVMMEISGCAAR